MTAPDETAAVILEPVLGEGGYIPAPQAFIDGHRRALPRSTGSCSSPTRCRVGSGAPARCSRSSTTASSPTSSAWRRASPSGFPFAALGTRRELDDQWPKGSHGGTYGGNPIGCAAALATIEVMSEPGVLRQRASPAASSCSAGHCATCSSEHPSHAPGPRARADGGQRASPTRHACRRSSAALPRRGPPDPDERRHLRHVPALDAAARRQRATRSIEALAAFGPRAQGHRLSDCRGLDCRPGSAPGADCSRWPPRCTRRIDADLLDEWDIPLGVVRRPRRVAGCSGDGARPARTSPPRCAIPSSSLSRRLDRLEEEGWVRRHRDVDPDDHRAVEVELTAAVATCGGR